MLPVSTGKDLGPHATRTGFKRVYYKVNRWQRSTLFPEPDGRPGLYRPIYFDRGIAFHGVRKAMRTDPQSHGCVRTWPAIRTGLWNQAVGCATGLRLRQLLEGQVRRPWAGTAAHSGRSRRPETGAPAG